MPEGISTSFQPCPTASQPDSLQELPAHESLSAFQWNFPFLNINDLGLTLSPGSQLYQSNDATQASSPGEERDPYSDAVLASIIAGNVDTEYSLHEAQALSKPGDLSSLPSSGLDDMADIFSGSFFDPELASQNLGATSTSRKRVGGDAFSGDLEFWSPPEKRQAVDLYPTDNAVPSVDTPSLSPGNSSDHPGSDQPDISLHTPADVERSQTPDSLFDCADPLFDGLDFSEPPKCRPTHSHGGYSLETETSGEDQVHDPPAPGSALDCPADNAGVVTLDAVPSHLSTVASSLPSASDAVKQRFSLNDQDTKANTCREILRRVDPEPEYLSPYPKYAGPLGYLPSTPAIHIKYSEVADTTINNRLKDLRTRLRKTAYERNQYKKTWLRWTTVDPITGKSKEKLLQEQNGMLKRTASHHKKKRAELQEEVDHWRTKHDEVARHYSNIAAHYDALREAYNGVQCRLNGILAAVQGHVPQQPGPQHAPNTMPPRTSSQPQAPAVPRRPSQDQVPTATNSNRVSSPISGASALRVTPEQVTIDLTESDDENPKNQPALPSGPTREQREMLRSMRNKSYSWSKSENTLNRPFPPGWRPVSHSCTTLQAPVHTNNSQATTHASHRSNASNTTNMAANTNSNFSEGDELARALEEELAG